MKLADTTYKFEHGVDSTIDDQTKKLMDTTSVKSDSSGSLINLPAERQSVQSSRCTKHSHTTIYISCGVATIICLAVMTGLSVKLHTLSKELEGLRHVIEYQQNIPPAATQTPYAESQVAKVTDSEHLDSNQRNNITHAVLGDNMTTIEHEGLPGSVYVHWGRTNCTGDAQTVYSGYGAGSSVSSTRMTGGGIQYLCMPHDPEWNKFDLTNDSLAFSWLYAAEILSYHNDIFHDEHHGSNVGCSVCWVPRVAKVMIPAKRSCPSPEWTLEYEGYLMASMSSQHKSTFECIDKEPDYTPIPGREAADGGALFYFVAAYCKGNSGVIGCPPYYGARELTCSVCTR